MSDQNPIEILKTAMVEFAASVPTAVQSLNKGERVINEGDEGNDIFLIQHGSVSILVKRPEDGTEVEVALRFNGDVIGETAILQRRGRRNASAQVVSPNAELIRLSRQDILKLIGRNAIFRQAVISIWELAATRRAETRAILDGNLLVENKVMSAILADIHNFSMLGEEASDELVDAFLFEFMEECEDISRESGGLFEDQGDGFKILFEGENYVNRATECASLLRDKFLEIRFKWAGQNAAFANIGLGVGVCTDCMSIRRRAGSQKGNARIVSHAINIAAAMAKYKDAPNDVDVFLDETSAAMLHSNQFQAGHAEEKHSDRLDRTIIVHRLTPTQARPNAGILGRNKTVDFIDPADRVNMLFLTADPSDAARLRLGEEIREIQEALQLSRGRDRFAFHQRSSVRPRDISQALLDVMPQIVHFSGHGAGVEGLCFETRDGQVQLVSAAALSALFAEFTNTVSCILLNACYSEVQATAIAKNIKYVIGMSNAISDKAAIAFGAGFYQALGAGKTFEEAFRFGRVRIDMESMPGDESPSPVLKIKR